MSAKKLSGERLTPEEMDELAGYPLDHNLMAAMRIAPGIEMMTEAEFAARLAQARIDALDEAAGYVECLFAAPEWRQSFALLGPRCVAGLPDSIRSLKEKK